MRVVRLVAVSEGGGNYPRPPMPMLQMAAKSERSADTAIDPGSQDLEITLSMSFDLQ